MAAVSWESLDSWFDILTLVGMSLQIQRVQIESDEHLLIYRQHHNLRLVCKAFRDLFKKHPSLSDCVWVREGLPASRLPQLLKALHTNQASTQSLISDAQAPAAVASLAVLLCPTPRLQNLTLNWASETTVHLVSAFTSLTFCEILQPEDALDALDAAPLSSLANLHELSLAYGTFNNVHPPDHLTWLRITQATAAICEEYAGYSSLLELHVGSCELSMPGLLGICAFTQLQVLECGNHTVVTAPNAANSLSLVAPIHVSAAFFSLSGLTKLSMIFSSEGLGGDIDTAWLYSLFHLQHLALTVYVDSDHDIGLCMALDDKFTRLNNLQYLMAAADADCAIHFCVPWHLMTALQCVDFQGSVGITGDISDLLQASRLETLEYISGIEEVNSGDVRYRYAPEAFVRPWKELEQYIQLHPPSVDCHFETTSCDDASSTV